MLQPDRIDGRRGVAEPALAVGTALIQVAARGKTICDDATRISCGPRRVPGTYDVVRSSGIGRMTTRALAKSVVVGVAPPNAPTVSCS